jgi:RimJ/RimL family protein N-acetyltransferase
MIKGSCFNLRPIQRQDLPTLLALLNDLEQRGDFLPMEIMPAGRLEDQFEEELRSDEARKVFLIVTPEDEIIGRVFYFKTVPYFNSREIGYALFKPAYRGKGIMTEAVQLLTNYLFKTALFNRLEIHMHVDNIASEKVAIHCGYQKEGIARGAHFSRGVHIDVAMYALLREEWQALQ